MAPGGAAGMLTMLDLFAGRGGASRVMRERDWRVWTVDNDPAFGCDETADLTDWHWTGGPVDLLWASPPCTEFSRERMPWCRTGVAPSLTLALATKRIIAEVRPRWWIVENVRDAVPYLDPLFGRFRQSHGAVFLWGSFPPFAAVVRPWKEHLSSSRPELRAEIPRAVSAALCDACEVGDLFSVGALRETA